MFSSCLGDTGEIQELIISPGKEEPGHFFNTAMIMSLVVSLVLAVIVSSTSYSFSRSFLACSGSCTACFTWQWRGGPLRGEHTA